MKFGFVTCVQLGLACMHEIYQAGGALDLVITLHDRLAINKSGRVYVDDFCTQHQIDLVKIRHINDQAAIDAIRQHQIDWLFIIGWSQIAGADVRAAPHKGCLGMHPTLLPTGRGRAAIPWAILKGLDQTGVTLFKLDQGVDTGPILAQEVLPLTPDETATTLYERVTVAHRTLISRIWRDLELDRLILQPQNDELATEWPGRSPEDGVILPEMTCVYVERLIRAVTHPYPGAFVDDDTDRYLVWRGIACPGGVQDTAVVIESNGTLSIRLADGIFFATEWTKQETL
ncbi:methionyl-tRNA formyltransferase [bacterium]|nr:methionyl-tRNA formyltransferase [bacterium]